MNDIAATPATTAAVPRTWRSLLTGRWHRSSWVVAVLVLVFLVFCNLPGQLVTLPTDQEEAFWGRGHQYEHGWPLTWATRYGDTWVLQLRTPEDVSCWAFWSDQPEFASRNLLWNFGNIVIVATVSGGAFELWRRARRKLCQLHLRDLLAILLLISLAGAWYTAARRRYAHELKICGLPFVEGEFTSWARREPIHGIKWYSKTSGGITWLRRLLGESSFQFLDRVIAAEVEPAGIQWVAQLPDVGAVAVEGDVTGDDLAHLQKLPLLAYLSISRYELSTWQQEAKHSSPRLMLPHLPQVYELNVSDFDVEGLGNLPSLEFIEWWGEPIDEPLFRQLAALPNLQYVEFHQCRLLDGGLSQLKSNPRLTQLSFSLVLMPADCLKPLGEVTQLDQLELSSCTLNDPDEIRHLRGLSRLKTLDLRGTNVDDGPVCDLAQLSDLRGLNLAGTRVTSIAIQHLETMKQLRDLGLTDSAFSSQEKERLKASLPVCKIEFLKSSPR